MRLALAFVLLSASAYATDLQSVNDHFNQSIHYRDYNGWDLRNLPDGGEGNCTTIAYNKWLALRKEHSDAKIQTCELSSGRWHAFVTVGDWALDNRQPRVVKFEEVGCGSIVLTANPRPSAAD